METLGTWKEFGKNLKWKKQMITMVDMIKGVNFCSLMYLKTFEICNKTNKLDPRRFFLRQD